MLVRVGGGMMRDILLAEIPVALRVRLYPIAALETPLKLPELIEREFGSLVPPKILPLSTHSRNVNCRDPDIAIS
jgi:hypothetical protein